MKSPLQISLCGCEVASLHPPTPLVWNAYQKATTYLVVDIGGQEKKKHFFFLSKSRFLQLYTQAPQREDKPEEGIHKIYICFFVFR